MVSDYLTSSICFVMETAVDKYQWPETYLLIVMEKYDSALTTADTASQQSLNIDIFY